MFFGPVFFGGQTSGKSYGLASDSSKGEWRPGDNVVQLRFDRSGSAELAKECSACCRPGLLSLLCDPTWLSCHSPPAASQSQSQELAGQRRHCRAYEAAMGTLIECESCLCQARRGDKQNSCFLLPAEKSLSLQGSMAQ